MIWSMHDDDACQEKSHLTKLLRAKSCWKDCTRHVLRLYDYTAKWFLKIISISGRLKWDENYSASLILSLGALALQSFYESTMRQTLAHSTSVLLGWCNDVKSRVLDIYQPLRDQCVCQHDGQCICLKKQKPAVCAFICQNIVTRRKLNQLLKVSMHLICLS